MVLPLSQCHPFCVAELYLLGKMAVDAQWSRQSRRRDNITKHSQTLRETEEVAT